jgi:hypothetical protein
VAEVAPNSLVNVKRAHLKILLKKGNFKYGAGLNEEAMFELCMEYRVYI